MPYIPPKVISAGTLLGHNFPMAAARRFAIEHGGDEVPLSRELIQELLADPEIKVSHLMRMLMRDRMRIDFTLEARRVAEGLWREYGSTERSVWDFMEQAERQSLLKDWEKWCEMKYVES